MQERLLPEEIAHVKACDERLTEITAELDEIREGLSEEDDETRILDDDNAKYVKEEVAKAFDEACADSLTPEIETLTEYLNLKGATKRKLAFMSSRPECDWFQIDKTKTGICAAASVKERIVVLKGEIQFGDGTFEAKVARVSKLLAEQKVVKDDAKASKAALEAKTKEIIENLSHSQAIELLDAHWVEPMVEGLAMIPNAAFDNIICKVRVLSAKYATTYEGIRARAREASVELVGLMGNLTGSKRDIAGVNEMRDILGGE